MSIGTTLDRLMTTTENATDSILFACQGRSLELFYRLSKHLGFKRNNYLVSDSFFFKKNGYDELIDPHQRLLEWEEFNRPVDKCDAELRAYLSEFEREYSPEFSLRDVCLTDRRISMGKLSVLREDNSPKFSERQKLEITYNLVSSVLRFFNQTKPQIVVTFICVTSFDYITYLICQKKNIKFFNLRPSRIDNYIFLDNSIYEPAGFFEKYIDRQSTEEAHKVAVQYIDKTIKKGLAYEGVIQSTGKVQTRFKASKLKKIGTTVSDILFYFKNLEIRGDNHLHNPILSLYYLNFYNNVYDKLTRLTLKDKYTSLKLFKDEEFIFYPLHTEPEVSLLVYGKPLIDQLNIIKIISLQLPIGKIMVIKEHPWMVGKRNIKFYREVLKLGNVRIAEPSLKVNDIIEFAESVLVVTGSTGYDAILCNKPLITLGRSPFNCLPENMVLYLNNITDFYNKYQRFLDIHETNLEIVRKFIANIVDHSVSVNLYSDLLGRNYVEKFEGKEDPYLKLAQYLGNKIFE